MVISIDTEKVFDKIQHDKSIHDKNSQQTRNRRELPQHDTEHLQKNYS